jgi:predicted aspartyl protease
MIHAYLDSYYPPVPALTITLGYPGEALRLGPFSAIVDTGADGTLIPIALLDALGAPFVDEARIRSHWGEWRTIQLFTVDIGVNELRFPAIEAIGDEHGEELILGRNFLNKLHLLLKGPRVQVELLDRWIIPAPRQSPRPGGRPAPIAAYPQRCTWVRSPGCCEPWH